MNATDSKDPHVRWVEAFAQAWRAPADGESLVEQFRPWLRADYRFSQPLTGSAGVGLVEFRDRFAVPLFTVMNDVQGRVESWAARGDTIFIELAVEGRVGRRRVCLRACDRVTLVDGFAADRQSYLDPLPLIAAVLCTPRLWWPALRWQLDEAIRSRTT
jgi:hypothetical protein